MPRGDGTGPLKRGAGMGMGKGGGQRMARGPSGSCVCPKCGTTVPHQRGVPCNQIKCPNCGTFMTRGD